jgi:hypothetical protein
VPGDTLLLYTDGIVEANDPDGEEYGNAVAATRRDGLAAAPCSQVAHHVIF